MKIIFTYIFIFTNIFTTLYSQSLDELPYERLIELPAESLIKTGNQYYHSNNIDTALIYYTIVAGRYDSANSSGIKYTIESLRKVGDIYYTQSNYLKALDYYLKGFQLSELHKLIEELPEFYNNIGNIYSYFQDFERSMHFYEEGLKLSREQNKIELESKLLNNLIGVSCYMGNTIQAKNYYNQVIKLKLPNDTVQQYFNILDLAYIYKTEEKYDSAIVYYKKSLDYSLLNKLDPRFTTSSSSELALLYELTNRDEEALEYLLFSNKIITENNLIDLLSYNLKSLSIIYDKKGEKEKALYFQDQHIQLSDSIFNMREFNRMKNTQLAYEMEKIDQQVKLLNAEKEKKELQVKMQQRIMVIISLGLGIFIVLLIIVSIQNKKLKNAYIDLFDRNNEIIKSSQTNKKMRIEYEKKLNEEKEYTQRLKEELELIGGGLMEENGENPEDTDNNKNNKLSEEQKEKILADITNIMENTLEFCDCEFSLTRLATMIGSNTKYVSQLINEAYHKNFRTYINEYRIKEASLRLMDTDNYGNYTIKAIAESVGYKSHTNFILIFKKITGINPSTYQKIAKKQLKGITE